MHSPRGRRHLLWRCQCGLSPARERILTQITRFEFTLMPLCAIFTHLGRGDTSSTSVGRGTTENSNTTVHLSIHGRHDSTSGQCREPYADRGYSREV